MSADRPFETLQPVSEGALHLSAEYLRLFVIEAFHRSVELAKTEEEEMMKKSTTNANGKSLPVELKVSAPIVPLDLVCDLILDSKTAHLEEVITGVILDFI